jgi:hypothetical protein
VALLEDHVGLYREVFAIPGFFAEPVAVFGFQDFRVKETRERSFRELPPRLWGKKLGRSLRRWRRWLLGRGPRPARIPAEYRVADLSQFLRARGLCDVTVIDLFDPRADRRWDMNLPVPREEHERYGTFIDMGSLEHVFDTRQCMENGLRMVRPGGIYFLVVPVHGFFGHGLHVFHPDALVQCLELNGFDVLYRRFSDKQGVPIARPDQASDAHLWLVGRKRARLEKFEIPQQRLWEEWYGEKPP